MDSFVIPMKPPVEPDNKFFKMSANQIIETGEIYPLHEGQHPLFKRFGTRTAGVCEQWVMDRNWRAQSDTDKWKYIALCSLYWLKQYQYWSDQRQYQNYLNYMKELNKEQE